LGEEKSTMADRLKPVRFAEAIFNSPRLYRCKFFFTGAAVAVMKPIFFHRDYFEFQDLLCTTVRNNERVCEIGCGDGENYRLISTTVGSFDGIDINPHMIEHCRIKYRAAQWHCGEAAKVLDGRVFDLCIISNVLHHLPDREYIVNLLRAALKSSGRILLFEPLQSEIAPLRLVKRTYWALTDGGNLYCRLADFHGLFVEAGGTPIWERHSAPFRQFYSCLLTAAPSETLPA
jgi:SAM-dependent methyltransferase